MGKAGVKNDTVSKCAEVEVDAHKAVDNRECAGVNTDANEKLGGESGKKNNTVTDSDIDKYRNELGNPLNTKTGEPLDTVAVGKTDVIGLENKVFKGASPTVRTAAGLSSLDEQYPDRAIKAPWDTRKRGYGQFTRHAEEGVMAEFEAAIKEAGIEDNDVKGNLYIHQSNSDGVCPMCTMGLFEESDKKGIFRQLTEKYPNLNIVVTTDTRNGVPSGRSSLTFNVIGGKVTNWTKK